MLYLSPRNSLNGHINVLDKANCSTLIKASDSKVDQILGRKSMRTFESPELNYFVDSESSAKPYPYTKSFEEGRMDPCLVLHTTGSTGLPKPVTWKLGMLSTYDIWRTIPEIDGCVPAPKIYKSARRAFSSLPLFHTSGLNAGITFALVLGITLVLGAPHVVPSAHYTDQMHQHADVQASMGAPSIYEDLSDEPDSLERIKRMAFIIASGGESLLTTMLAFCF